MKAILCLILAALCYASVFSQPSYELIQRPPISDQQRAALIEEAAARLQQRALWLVPGMQPDERVTQIIRELSTWEQQLVSTCGVVNASLAGGSGIGSAVTWTLTKPAVRQEVTVNGIMFPYDGSVRSHSNIGGCGENLYINGKVFLADGTICEFTTVPGSRPPHSAACNENSIKQKVSLVNAASYGPVVAPGSIGAAFFDAPLGGEKANAQSTDLPTQLAGVEATLFLNTPRQVKTKLFYASPNQINLLLPDDLPTGGTCTVAVLNVNGEGLRAGAFFSQPAAPGVFTTGQDGAGEAAACWQGDQLILYATSLNPNLPTRIYDPYAAVFFPVSYAGRQRQYVGLDQVNAFVPAEWGGRVIQVINGQWGSQHVVVPPRSRVCR